MCMLQQEAVKIVAKDNEMSKYLTSAVSCLIILAALLSLRIYDPKPVEQIRLISLDYYQNSLELKESNVHVLNIGEQSLEKIWPVAMA